MQENEIAMSASGASLAVVRQLNGHGSVEQL